VLEYAAALRAVASDSGVFCFCLYLYLDLNASNAVVSGTVMSVAPRPCAPGEADSVALPCIAISCSSPICAPPSASLLLYPCPFGGCFGYLWRCLVFLSLALSLFVSCSIPPPSASLLLYLCLFGGYFGCRNNRHTRNRSISYFGAEISLPRPARRACCAQAGGDSGVLRTHVCRFRVLGYGV